jgi:molybdate transport system substrate-binding protein
VLDYVARAEVDAGMVYSTDARLRIKGVRVIKEAPSESHSPVVYPIAVVKGTKKRTLSEEFISFVISDRGRTVLMKYGFKPAEAEDN